ncbi:MAG: FkbM family methyltransferase, partial [Casimicrobiaceae bacterium]|nr:FkbM family methyltransferase [Casimicrobiaceae bacterium]
MISYAQNFEDVLLFRALKHIDKGFYIDVGAQHPVIDSVSLAFYERGWRGIHIEPVSHYARLLREHRPDETVLEVAIAANAGVRKFFEIPDTGLSTLDLEIAQQHQHAGFSAREITVATLPLSSVFDSLNVPHVHWLKIDVEGAEAEVLQSWAASTVRPWIVVVESTWPNRPDSNHDRWEPILFGFGYV